MEQHRLDPIRIGFPYEVSITFPAAYLASGEGIRASLRASPRDAAALVSFTSARDGDTITLSLSKVQTAALSPNSAVMDLVITAAAPATTEWPITSPRFLVAIEHHATRAT